MLSVTRPSSFCTCRIGGGILVRYLAVIEKTDGNYSSYSPNLPGCVATGDTIDELQANMQEVIRMHIQGLREDGIPVPEPKAMAEYLEVEEMVE